jgi:methionyl aminopeptidase
MCFTVEPILNEQSGFTYVLEDQWTIKTIDSALSAQFEHTVLVTRGGYKILTKL